MTHVNTQCASYIPVQMKMVIDVVNPQNLFTNAVTGKASTLSPEENCAPSASVCRIPEGFPAEELTLAFPRKNEPEDNEKELTLTARLRSTEGTFRVHNIYGDGNCLFRAVSYILWGNEDEHRSLRTLVTHHIRSHWREYGPFVTAEWNITSPDEYFDFMISEGIFATELECTVATKIYKMNLSIYREINDRGDIKRVFHNRLNGSYETARLLFSGRSDSGHYDVLFLDS